jgi:hypothetical protein
MIVARRRHSHESNDLVQPASRNTDRSGCVHDRSNVRDDPRGIKTRHVTAMAVAIAPAVSRLTRASRSGGLGSWRDRCLTKAPQHDRSCILHRRDLTNEADAILRARDLNDYVERPRDESRDRVRCDLA